MPKGPLNGIRIVELEGIGTVPFCGMHFADLGADVILVERKSLGSNPIADKGAGITKRGKRSIALDLKDPEDISIALDLISGADALIEGMRPGVTERLGLGPDVCLERNPRLVYGRVTGWGQTGPLAHAAGHDLNYIGLSSAAWYASPPGQPQCPPPTLIGDIGGGAHYLMIGVLAGILQARVTGKGDVVDAAMVDGSAHMMNLLFDLRPIGLFHNERGKSLLDGPHWYAAYVCADGKYISLGALETKFYQEFLKLMDLDEDPLFKDQYDASAWPAQAERLKSIFASRTRGQWRDLLEGTDACFAPILDPDEAAAHPHNVARAVFDTGAGHLQANVAPRFRSMATITPPSSPRPGEHTEEILRELRGGD